MKYNRRKPKKPDYRTKEDESNLLSTKFSLPQEKKGLGDWLYDSLFSKLYPKHLMAVFESLKWFNTLKLTFLNLSH